MFKTRQLLLASFLVGLSHQQCFTPSAGARRPSERSARSLLQSEMQFSADLLHTLGNLYCNENLLISPSGLYKTVLLAYLISANRSEGNLKRVLHLENFSDKQEVYDAYKQQQEEEKQSSSKYQLNIVNHLYVALHLRVRDCMKKLLREEMYLLNFQNMMDPERMINSWMAMKTKYVFAEDFLLEGQLARNDRLVLINAAHFMGKWENQFKAENTEYGDFYMDNGTSLKIPMMSQRNQFKLSVLERLSVEVVDLPYAGCDISMFILRPLVPGTSAIPRLLKQLDIHTLYDILRSLNDTDHVDLKVTIPKFTLEKTVDLQKILDPMGVGDLFGGSADLGTLATDRGLLISEALHKVKLGVQEMGTEPAAKSGHSVREVGLFKRFLADRPFVYFLYDKKFKIVLFLGVFSFPELE